MQIERFFEIVYTLLDRGTVTAQELADKLNVSKRTILRDIETLALAKVPVYTTQGKGGGVSLLDGYVLDKAVLSDEEKEQILLGIKTLLPTGNASDKALSKLGSLFAVKNTDNTDWQQKQEKLNAFLGPALEVYFNNLGVNPFEAKND